MTSKVETTSADGRETAMQKFARKFKQEPLVPIGAGLTCVALTMASMQLIRGNSKKLNHWLRARVIFQGLTIAAVAGGSWYYGQTKQQIEEQRRRDAMETEYEQVKERRAFEARLKEAEEIHAAEQMALAATTAPQPMSATASKGIWERLGWKNSSN